MSSIGFERTDFNTAEEFLEYLRPSAEHWLEGRANDWIYRGVYDYDGWRLVPSSWRDTVREPFEHFKAALNENPDYVAVGPMFPSTTKPQKHIAGPQTLAAASELTDLPIVAIGGITSTNAGEIVTAGATMIAVCSAIIGAKDAQAASEAIVGARSN